MLSCIKGKGPHTFCGQLACIFHLLISFASYEGMCCGASDLKECEDKKCYCGKKKVDCWDKEKNENLMPHQVTKKSGKKQWFKCPTCNHLFDIHPNNIQNGKWCPYCSMPPRKMCHNDECNHCNTRSFASHEFAVNWSIENRDQPKDYDGLYLPPRWVFKQSNNKYMFKCPNCNHTYSSILSNVTKGQRCDYCSPGTSSLCDDYLCLYCKEKSFASHEMAQYWSPQNKVTPRQITKGTDSKYLFDCPNCYHTFEASAGSVSRGHFCPYCCYPPQKLCSPDKNCDRCYQKSFASSPYANQWSSKNTITAKESFVSSNQDRYFDCIYCTKTYKMKVSDFTAGNRCGSCKNKTEKKLYNFLIEYYSTLIHRFAPDWCVNPETNRHWPYDFVIEIYKLIIELDGPQHYKQISNWTPVEEVQRRDKLKEKIAIDNKYHVIRISQEDVWYDRNNWKETVLEEIKKYI